MNGDAVVDRMRGDWDRRAEEDYKLHIATGHSSSIDAFAESGAHDLDDSILDGIELLPSAKALEIGCGVGRLLLPLSKRIAFAGGVDISEVMIRKSKEYTSRCENVRTERTAGQPCRLRRRLDRPRLFVHRLPAHPRQGGDRAVRPRGRAGGSVREGCPVPGGPAPSPAGPRAELVAETKNG